ncbi:GNAT family N-acetyltransferase [Leucobacter sp. HY1908]
MCDDETPQPPAYRVRPFVSADSAALADVCTRTANVGADATGMLCDDALWGDLFAVPYGVHDASLCWVVEAVGGPAAWFTVGPAAGRVVGYIVGTADTRAFARWFRTEWWASRAGRYLRGAQGGALQDEFLAYGDGISPEAQSAAASALTRDYPAHLHINLLPEAQGSGLGRRLINTLCDELVRRGVPGLHLTMNAKNAPAGAFYERLGFRFLATDGADTTYGMRFAK